ncbi:MoaD/ThiS family protein [Campylobacter avium]|uniref:MoaD/ThiS family protein n=1 Tax=Campylobacter avium TaxID=522485 RepID=UPI00255B66EB|nr:MoaD/ThiS family protein [Campylobacter avium]
MATVNFLGPINKKSISVTCSSLKELKEFLSEDKDLKEWLSLCAVTVNDKIVSSLDIKLKDDDVVNLLPPVSGG